MVRSSTLGASSQPFTTLGERIDRAWRAQGYDERVFPDLATRELARSNPSRWARPDEILREFLVASTRPAQHAQEFGSPGLVMYAGHHFIIELLCWTTGTVGLHRHGFSGAFHLVLGSSLHSTFDFEVVRRVNSRFLIGNLRRTGTEILEAGATRTVHAIKLIHSHFHLDTPSVTIVVRTRFEAEAKPQYTYEPPYLAIDPFYGDPVALRQHQALGFLAHTGARTCRKAFVEYVTHGDLQACYDGLRIAFPHGALFADLRAAARKAHGPIVDLFVPVLREHHRRRHLIASRAQITDVEHRFFVGMLLNLERREDILRMVAARYRGAPQATILRWIRALSAAGNATLGLEATDAQLDVIDCLLHGRTLPQTLRSLGTIYGAGEVRAQRAAISDFYEALRANELYRPLFQDEGAPLARADHRE